MIIERNMFLIIIRVLKILLINICKYIKLFILNRLNTTFFLSLKQLLFQKTVCQVMLEFLSSLEPENFHARFDDPDKCYAFLAKEKWRDGFVCRNCGHTNYCRGRTPYSRRCTRCKKEESVKAHTIFHHCRIPICEALEIVYQVCHNPGISSYRLSERMHKRQMTCWKLKKKVMDCLERRGLVNK